MKYITENLNSNEEIKLEGEVHWFVLALGLFGSIVVAIMTFIFSMFLFSSFFTTFIFALIVAAGTAGYTYLLFKNIEIAVTNQRVVSKEGFIARKTEEAKHSKVEAVNIDQNIFGRIFNFGDVVVKTAGGSWKVPMIKDPLNFRKQAVKIIDPEDS